jgi:hypothetical protein
LLTNKPVAVAGVEAGSPADKHAAPYIADVACAAVEIDRTCRRQYAVSVEADAAIGAFSVRRAARRRNYDYRVGGCGLHAVRGRTNI